MKTMNKVVEKNPANFRLMSASLIGLLKEIRAFQRTNVEINQLLRTDAFVDAFHAVEVHVQACSSKLYEALSKSGGSTSTSVTQARTQVPRGSDDIDMIDDIQFMDEVVSNHGQ